MQNKCQKQLILIWRARQGLNQRTKQHQKILQFPRKPGLPLKTSVFVSSKEKVFGFYSNILYKNGKIRNMAIKKLYLLNRSSLYSYPAFQGGFKATLQTRWQWVWSWSPALCLGYVLQNTVENTTTSSIKQLSDCSWGGRL